MAAQQGDSKRLITAGEVANYIVCPEAWRLKFVQNAGRRLPGSIENAARLQEGQRVRKEWVEKQNLSLRLRFYAKVAYALLVALVFGAYLFETHLERKVLRNRREAGSSTAGTQR